jgi:hypothetical protein
MDIDILELFNNGQNDGTIEIISSENTCIKCHDFVFEKQCDLGRSKSRFEKNNGQSNVNTITLNYSTKVITLIISKMYSSQFDFKNIDINEIIQLIFVATEIGVKYCDPILDELSELFYIQIKKNNWLDILEQINDHVELEFLKKVITKYFRKKIILPNLLKISNISTSTDPITCPKFDTSNESIANHLKNIFDKEVKKLIEKDKKKKEKEKNKNQISAYQVFIVEHMRKFRSEYPGKSNADYMRMAALAWTDYKNKMLQNTE